MFLSYRRDDSMGIVGRIRDQLADAARRRPASSSTSTASRWESTSGSTSTTWWPVATSCWSSSVAVGSTRWTSDGRRRLEQSGDFVRLEVEAALRREIPVVPVLVDGATIPEPGELPAVAHRPGVPQRDPGPPRPGLPPRCRPSPAIGSRPELVEPVASTHDRRTISPSCPGRCDQRPDGLVLHGHTDVRERVRRGARRHLDRLRLRRRHVADLGRRHRHDPPHPRRPHRRRATGVRWRPTAPGSSRRPRQDVADLGRRHRHDPPHPRPATPATSDGCAVAPDGTWIVSASSDKTLRIWDVATGTTRHTLAGHTDYLYGVRGGARRHLARLRLRRQDVADLGRRHRRRPATPWPATPTPVRVCGGARRHLDRLRLSATRRCGSGMSPPARPAAPSTATRPACTGVRWRPTAPGSSPPLSDKTLRIWDVATGTTRRTLDGHTSDVWACATAPDGTWIVSAADDDTLRIWDVATGRPLGTADDLTAGATPRQS